MNGTFIIKFKIIDGKLKPIDGLSQQRLKEYLLNCNPETEINCIMETVEPNNTKAQLAKIHVMIKEIADEQGDNVKDVKNNIKDQVGLTYYENGIKKYKSFADCSRETLSKVIESIYIIGDFLNINFRKDLG